MAGLVVLTWLGTLIMVCIYWRCHGRKRTGHSQLQETNGEGSWRIGGRSFRSSPSISRLTPFSYGQEDEESGFGAVTKL